MTLASSFFFAQFCTSIFWGHMSDRYGRRPILLLGLCGSSISCIFFGLSKSLAWAVVSRSMCGLLNGKPTSCANNMTSLLYFFLQQIIFLPTLHHPNPSAFFRTPPPRQIDTQSTHRLICNRSFFHCGEQQPQTRKRRRRKVYARRNRRCVQSVEGVQSLRICMGYWHGMCSSPYSLPSYKMYRTSSTSTLILTHVSISGHNYDVDCGPVSGRIPFKPCTDIPRDLWRLPVLYRIPLLPPLLCRVHGRCCRIHRRVLFLKGNQRHAGWSFGRA